MYLFCRSFDGPLGPIPNGRFWDSVRQCRKFKHLESTCWNRNRQWLNWIDTTTESCSSQKRKSLFPKPKEKHNHRFKNSLKSHEAGSILWALKRSAKRLTTKRHGRRRLEMLEQFEQIESNWFSFEPIWQTLWLSLEQLDFFLRLMSSQPTTWTFEALQHASVLSPSLCRPWISCGDLSAVLTTQRILERICWKSRNIAEVTGANRCSTCSDQI